MQDLCILPLALTEARLDRAFGGTGVLCESRLDQDGASRQRNQGEGILRKSKQRRKAEGEKMDSHDRAIEEAV